MKGRAEISKVATAVLIFDNYCSLGLNTFFSFRISEKNKQDFCLINESMSFYFLDWIFNSSYIDINSFASEEINSE